MALELASLLGQDRWKYCHFPAKITIKLIMANPDSHIVFCLISTWSHDEGAYLMCLQNKGVGCRHCYICATVCAIVTSENS